MSGLVAKALVRGGVRKDAIVKLATIEAAHGKELATEVAEAFIEAAALYLKGSLGARGAFSRCQRFADAICSDIIEKQAR